MPTMTLKDTLQQANDAIAKGDFEGFLAHCTDDTVWRFLGDRVLTGKEAVRRWMTETYTEPPRFHVRQTIAEGDMLAVLGEISLKDEAGTWAQHAYCDVWRFESGLMAELNAFVIAPT
jgi:uncharacterized protein